MISDEIKKEVEKEFLTKINYKRSYDEAKIIPVSIVSDPKEHDEWYDEWFKTNNDNVNSYYWFRLKDFLERSLSKKYGAEKAGHVVKSIDHATNDIMRKMANPARKSFDYKGLVVGYVQSGKTANFTALIAKSVDAGYKFIVVLSGIHSILRRQTQIRLDKELTGMNDLRLDQVFINEPSEINNWNRLTTSRVQKTSSRNGVVKYKDLGEFTEVNLSPFNSYCRKKSPTIAIIKKNVKVLNRLIEYIQTSSSDIERENMPLLIIDDEADQASVDGKSNDPDSDRAATNDRIRKLLTYFTRKAYVGYTATPFANVLIDMSTNDYDVNDDLYPRNFIVALPDPNDSSIDQKEYFGSSLIFQSNLSDFFICSTGDSPDQFLTEGKISNDLSEAIDSYIMACAIRNLRGDRKKPMSMLVHISHKTDFHDTIMEIIQEYVDNTHGRYKNNLFSEKLKKDYLLIWEKFKNKSQKIKEELKLENKIPNFESIWDEIENVFEVLQVLVLNSKSTDRLDYTTEDETKVIAIGGNQLSRGLTLEGLMISYYLRESKQYDTLLQMGRWFGYRKGYEDLTRVYTTNRLWRYFQHLAEVEEELRRDIKRYEDTENTPEDLALTIRTHSRMMPTSKNKLGAAEIQRTSYSDSLHQTFRFPLDLTEKIRSNLSLGKKLVKELSTVSGFYCSMINDSIYLTQKTYPSNYIITHLINKYNFEQRYNGPGIDVENLKDYIFRRSNDGELQNWRIGVAGSNSGKVILEFKNYQFKAIRRSRLENNIGFDCGVITDKTHLLADLKKGAVSRSDGRDPNHPLLLLYFIDSDSKARKDGKNRGRVDLYHNINSEKLDVFAFALVLPESNKEPYNRIGQ